MLTEKRQERAARSNNVDARIDLAQNPALVERLQEVLAKDKDMWVHASLAANPALVERVQDVLTKDVYWLVRFILAKNPALKLKPAILLYFDEDERVVESLEDNNSELYQQIVTLEKKALKDANVPFVGVGNETQRRVIGKKLLIQPSLGL